MKERLYIGCAIEDYLVNPALEIRPLQIKKNSFLITSTIELAKYSVFLYNINSSENPSEKIKEINNGLQEAFKPEGQ